jgi:signal transduction histidine kinase
MQLQSEQFHEQTIRDLEHEIDKLKAENLQLQQQLAQKEQFTAMIAHDLRGPLAPIINYAQMLARNNLISKDGSTLDQRQMEKKNASIQRGTRIIVSQAKRMSRLVNDLLDASHLSSGSFKLLREPCDIVQLVNEMVEQLRPVAPHHTLTVIAPDGPLLGDWDSGRLQQALGNLLDNAIKYSDEQTTITVAIATKSDKVLVSVHNQGVSIPSTEVGQLFRPFSRLTAANMSSRQGSGLGLYITKSIINEHGGVLRLESYDEEGGEEDQKGTTFTFELPLLQKEG